MNDERKTALRVGIFMTVGLAVASLALFTLGSKSGTFESHSTLIAYFGDISGLVPGAPVRLAGLDVGSVRRIAFSDDLTRREARVEISIKERFMPRVRGDSRAFIDSKGLLGDKLINITIGSPAQPQLKDGDTIKTRAGFSIEDIAAKVDQAVQSINHVSDEAGVVIEGLAKPEMQRDMQRFVHSLADVTEGVAQRDSVVHRLFFDPAYADQVSGILQNAQLSLAALRGALDHVQAIAANVRSGDGTLHQLIYGSNGAKALDELAQAADELAALTHAVRDQPGLLHTLIYDPKGGDLLKDWTEFSERVNRISQNVEKGRGSVGGLLVDPSVYEDMKTVLGNIERNVLFKALIRYTIREGHLERPARMPREAKPQ